MPYASEVKREAVRRWWEDRDTFGTALLALLIDEYGTQALEWDPETIRIQLHSDYGAVVSRQTSDKLMAIISALTTNLFYTSVEAFTQIANSLNGAEADFNNWDPVDTHEAAWALTEVTLNDPPKRNEQYLGQFSEDVRKYIGVICLNEGILTPPDILQVAIIDQQAQKSADITFADDPEMFSGFYKLSQDKSKAISRYVQDNMSKLVKQLNEIPLQNRDQSRWTKFMDSHKPRSGYQTESAPVRQ